MDSLFTRYRNLVVLLAFLVVQIAGLAVQVRRTSYGRSTLDTVDPKSVRLIRLWANAVVSPPERLIHATKIGSTGLWTDYFDLIHVRQQNQDLQKTVDRLRLEQAALLEDARQGQRLQAMLGFQEKYIYTTVPAQVYGSSGSDRSHVFYIDKGAHNGLKPDMAVITSDGIVGKVRDVFPYSAQVLAVNDPTSGAGVILETTRIRGVLKGDVAGRLEVVGVTADQRIKPGENVLTAGGDLIFPRGLPVGVVERVATDPDNDGLVDIYLKPATHLDRLDEVLVITSTEPRFSKQDQQDITTSENLKGAEAATISDQLKAAQIMGEKLPGLVDPSLPPDKQPLYDDTNPNPATPPPQPLHPDEFSPGAAYTPPSATNPPAGSGTGADNSSASHAPSGAGSKAAPASHSTPQTPPQRNL
ncbi:Rod shape-determining protein MreC [Candidatus Sulfotelmatomonas gaucii]|uniref:Cell shape-determining protein MreC n=1 Tax=Candidatus Sulfuritelmatomonas gaucii TaxID=2043161 RepID=A0A2N9M8B6_9BACT|nr:Rod shape-determining protein MreC [Candidatus Sulfotelmatomonas gaucii]